MRRPKSQGRSFVVGRVGPAACSRAASCMRMTLACQPVFGLEIRQERTKALGWVGGYGREADFSAALLAKCGSSFGRNDWTLFGVGGLDERLGGLDGVLHDVAGLVDGALNLAACPFERLFRLFAETLCLLLEIVGCIFEVVACVLDALAELSACSDTGLRSVKESDCGSCGDADAESEPVIFCTHFDVTSCLIWLLFPLRFLWIAIGWLFYTVSGCMYFLDEGPSRLPGRPVPLPAGISG